MIPWCPTCGMPVQDETQPVMACSNGHHSQRNEWGQLVRTAAPEPEAAPELHKDESPPRVPAPTKRVAKERDHIDSRANPPA